MAASGAASAADAAPAAADRRYDLTMKMAPFLDPQLVLLMVDFLATKGMYDEEELDGARLEILKDLARPRELTEVFESLNGPGSAPEELVTAADNSAERERLAEAARPFTDLVEEARSLGTSKDSESFFTEVPLEERGVTAAHLAAARSLALELYRTGEDELVEEAARLLHFLRLVVPEDAEEATDMRWGKLAAELLIAARKSRDFSDAAEDAEDIAAAQQKHPAANKAEQLQQRCWLAHWQLFVAMGRDGWQDAVATSLLQEDTINAVVFVCPWLVRYVGAALIMRGEPTTSSAMRSLLHALKHHDAAKGDPILDLLRALLVRFDFADAEAQLARAEACIRSDFFLGGLSDADTNVSRFLEAARQLVFQTHCRLNSTVAIDALAAQLGLDPSRAEEWVVATIRKAHIDAQIDTARGLVVMRTDDAKEAPGRVVLSRTADLVARTRALKRSVEQAVYAGGGGGGERRGAGGGRRGPGGRRGDRYGAH